MGPRKKKQEGAEEGRERPPADMAGPEADRESTADEVEEGGPGAADDPTDAEAAPAPEEVIASLQDELNELEDRHLRLAAEFDNFRKRTLREQGQQTQRAQAELARELLESLDDLTRVSELSSAEHDAAAILEGVELVETKLRRALESFGLERIDAVGEPFDPEVHEALITVPTDDADEDNRVGQQVSPGYLFKGALLRPALVEVKKYRPADAGGAAGAEDES